ncbi:MAG TPA: TIGR03118 family protein, partial [Acidobacteriaceae bacterium]
MPIPRNLRIFATVTAMLAGFAAPGMLSATTYSQLNLVSDIPGNAALTDPNLVNPWGVSFNATSPFWISANDPGLATLYTGAPTIAPLVVTVPGGPTGQVNNGNTSVFKLSNGTAANFIFDTQAGTILGWNGGLGTSAAVVYTSPTANASYTGLAIGTSGGSSYLYAANMAGAIDVLNSAFQLTSLPGNFTDPTLPAGYVPYNIQSVGGKLYVTYVIYNASGDETHSGIVDVFNMDGTFSSRFSSSAQLDAPWGLTLAPTTFGSFGGDLLIGNFLNGEINAFDPVTGAFLGALLGGNGQPIADPGLWALEFRTGG